MDQKSPKLANIINLFKPEALKEDQQDYYQKTDAARSAEGFEFYESLYARIETAKDKSHILVVGHGGCGKSTELRMLTAKLRRNGIPRIIIEATEDLDLNNFSYIDIFMLIVERLTEYAQDENLQIDDKHISAFDKALSTTITQKYRGSEKEAAAGGGVSASVSLPFLFNFVSNIAASLKTSSGSKEELRREIEPKMKEIIKALNALIDAINENNNNPKMVIIIDGLEKCRSENAKKLFSEDIASLAAINTHLIIACPINIYRSPALPVLRNYFVEPAIMPMIKTHYYKDSVDHVYEEGVNVIKELVLKRVAATDFEEGVLENIIKMSGGNLRHTCRLISESAFTAYMRHRETVDMDSAENTMKKFAADLFLSAEYTYYDAIKKVLGGDRAIRNNEAISELLYTGVVFEYNGEGWIDLHPLIRRHIEQHPGVLA
jgi:energy-coupling factor transporter ATP-binding protein EcfA2